MKQGVAFSPSFQFRRTLLIEAYENNGWSLDIGTTSDGSHILVGLSKDILGKTVDINIGSVNGPKKTSSGYAGVSVKF